MYRIIADVCPGPEMVDPPLVRRVTARSVVLVWTAPGQPNGIIIQYQIYNNQSLVANVGYKKCCWCTSFSFATCIIFLIREHVYDVALRQYFLYAVVFRIQVTGDERNASVGGLMPFTRYVFAVTSCTVTGCTSSDQSLPIITLVAGERSVTIAPHHLHGGTVLQTSEKKIW